MKCYKYIHVFWLDDLKFNPRVVQMINNPDNQFNMDEHLFITPYKRVYDAISSFRNVVFFETKEPCNVEIVNTYGELGDWLIIHSMPEPHHALRIKPKYRRKIVWRTWGHDVGYRYDDRRLRNSVKHLIEWMWKKEVRNFYAIGVANVVDEIDVNQRFGDVHTVLMPYPKRGGHNALTKAAKKEKNDGGTVNVLIGHSGRSIDNHIAIMKTLEKYKYENVRLYFVLSYGDQDYIKGLCNYIRKEWGDQSEIITDFMEYETFVDFLNQMDIAILDGKRSYALGNISILLFLHKKIFLHRNGVICQGFRVENLPYQCTDEIQSMDFDEFSKPLEYDDQEQSSLFPCSYEINVERWHMLLNELNHQCRK